jgi:hypothetical protein
MAGRSRDQLAALEAERLIKELGIDSLPVDPIAISETLGILVQPKTAAGGVSGMLVRVGNDFAIGYATHIDNGGFKRFSVAHELGHYRFPATSKPSLRMAISMNRARGSSRTTLTSAKPIILPPPC